MASSNDRTAGYAQRNHQQFHEQLTRVYTGANSCGNPVYVPHGTWLIDRELTIDEETRMNNRSMYGAHCRMAVIKQDKTYHGTLLHVEDATYGEFRSFGLEGRGSWTLLFVKTWSTTWNSIRCAGGQIGAKFLTSQDTLIDRCFFEECSIGLVIEDFAFATIRHVNVQRCEIGILVAGGLGTNQEVRTNNASHEINGVYGEDCGIAVELNRICGVQVSRVHSRCKTAAIKLSGGASGNQIDATCCQSPVIVEPDCVDNTIVLRKANKRCKFIGDEAKNRVVLV